MFPTFPTVTIPADGTEAVLESQPAQADELTLRPSFFVGSGGTGHLTLLYLKAIFLSLHGRLPQGARIVVFDTAEENLSISLGGQQIALERGNEFRYIGRVPVAGIIQHIDNMPAIRDRLPQIANLPPVNLLDGTGQVRPLGLLALLWHIETVQQALKDPLWELAHKQNLGTLDGMRIDASRGISVFQVGSLCGGNNSGQFLDLAYLVRSLLEELGDLAEFSEIVGLGVLPDAFRNVRGPNLIPNTVAALHELDHCMIKGGFKATYRNGHVIDTPRPPFNLYYLLSAVDESGRAHLSLNELCWMAAMGLYHLAMSPIGDQQDSVFANLAEVLTHRTDDDHGTFFASFGLAELSFPADAVTTWCTYRHARSVISQGLLSPPVEDEVQRAVESTLQAQELTPDALHQYLAVDDTGIPLAVELQPPARIREADAHAMPQLAMNHVQTYRRQRVEGDFRIWVRENARRRQEHLLRDLSASIQAATDDPTRGLLFAHAFAQDIGAHLADLTAALTARRQALQSERSDREAQHDNSLTDLMHAPEAGWLFRGQAVERALDRYFKDAQEFLETQFELTIQDSAIAVVVAAQEHVRAWVHNLETLVNRLQAIDGELQRGQRDLADELLAPARSSRLALVDSSYLERLYQEHAPTIPATLDALLEDKSHTPHRWIDWTRNAVGELIIRAARQPFEAIQALSVEQAIQDRSDQMTARQWVQTLAQKARPAWNLNEVLLPDGAANLARIELLGVPDRERSIYAGDAARLVSTSDPHRITAFAMTAGAPFVALRRYEDYLRGYQRVRGKRPLHVLPDFLADGQSAKLAFALGHIYGFITDHGVYYYYQPADELDEPIKLAQGKENAIQALGNQDGLVREVMQRVEARIEDVGFDQAQQDLEAFYTAPGPGDELARELKRLVRDYAKRLQERRLV